MRLTVHTDHALRLLMLLAMEPEARHTVDDAARRYGISAHHLVKISQTLARAGFVESLRGRAGGLRLAKPAGAINLGAVVRATEDNFDLVECFDRAAGRCVIAPACGLRGPLEKALAAFLAVLDGYSLADLVAQPAFAGRMRQLLMLSESRPA